MIYFSRDAILLIREINYIIGLAISLAVVDIITQCTSGWASASSSEVCHRLEGDVLKMTIYLTVNGSTGQ